MTRLFLRIQSGLCDDPEVRVIMAAARVRNKNTVLGALVRFWDWAQHRMRAGRIVRCPFAVVDSIVEQAGFAEGMAAAGWLRQDGDDLVIPKWQRFFGHVRNDQVGGETEASAPPASASAERMRRKRQRDADVTGRDADVTLDVTLDVTGRDGDVTPCDAHVTGRDAPAPSQVGGYKGGDLDSDLDREEDREEEQATTPPPPAAGGDGPAGTPANCEPAKPPKAKPDPAAAVPIPAAIDTPEFRAAWAEFAQHRREVRRRLTPTSAKRTLATLARGTAAKAAYAVLKAVDKGWIGVQPVDAAEWDDAADAPRDGPAARPGPYAKPPPKSAAELMAEAAEEQRKRHEIMFPTAPEQAP